MKPTVIPTNWCDPLLTGRNRVIGDPPFTCPDIERLLLAIQQRHDAAMQGALKAERARVRRVVRKQKVIGKHPVSEVAETMEWIEGYFQACDDILNALKEKP